MDIDVLRSLVAVADTGSFSRAATLLCVSQSAVSKRIKLIEDKVALPLLDRSGPVLQLTPAGMIITKNARSIIDICCHCNEELKALKQCRNLSFCCTPAFGFSCLSEIVDTFTASCPDITSFTFAFEDPEKITEGLQNGTFQVAVVEYCDQFVVQGTVLETFPDDTMVLVGAPSLGVSGTGSTLDDVLPMNFYMRSEGCCSRRILDALLLERGRSLSEFNRVLAYDDLNMIVRAVLEGNGIAYIPRCVARTYLDDASMVVYSIPGFEKPFHRSLLAGPGFVSSPESDALIAIIKEISCR